MLRTKSVISALSVRRDPASRRILRTGLVQKGPTEIKFNWDFPCEAYVTLSYVTLRRTMKYATLSATVAATLWRSTPYFQATQSQPPSAHPLTTSYPTLPHR
ncbi:hypothetical protein HZH66_001088 [Vespula vulgaris]|uniref:Uncharacterized protein n=1 Tax=Vespula vulgaris TaxID=7454 RepID=A0A834KSN7_VESVU|nr:hypothetical protein HZH66_001088 [Vespula vulgaris]